MVNLTKEQALKNFVDLRKKADAIILSKGLSDITAYVKLVIDGSGSMRNLYVNGTMQRVIERVLAVGSRIDDNGEIEVYLFDDSAYELGEVRESDFYGFVSNKILSSYEISGGTSYYPVMKLISDNLGYGTKGAGFFQSLFKKSKPKEIDAEIPTFVLFITDGENFDQGVTTELIKKLSNKPIFWQFMGIGNGRFTFLKNLDEMDGRFIDNANFFQINDVEKIDDETLYNRMLNEFPSWIKLAKSKGVLK